MAKYGDIWVVGTSHIAKESVEKVKKAVNSYKPDFIALELDKQRLGTLLSKKKKFSLKALKEFGIKALFLNLIGSFIEKRLSKKTGILPGTEMKTAIKLAKEQKIKIALIDQPVNITLKKLTSRITRKEKFRFIKDILSSLFLRKKQVSFDLNKVPSEKVVKKLIEDTKEKYPTVYQVLIEERNKFMAKALYKLTHLYPKKKILAIVGAGHEEGIIGELKSIKN